MTVASLRIFTATPLTNFEKLVQLGLNKFEKSTYHLTIYLCQAISKSRDGRMHRTVGYSCPIVWPSVLADWAVCSFFWKLYQQYTSIPSNVTSQDTIQGVPCREFYWTWSQRRDHLLKIAYVFSLLLILEVTIHGPNVYAMRHWSEVPNFISKSKIDLLFSCRNNNSVHSFIQ